MPYQWSFQFDDDFHSDGMMSLAENDDGFVGFADHGSQYRMM